MKGAPLLAVALALGAGIAGYAFAGIPGLPSRPAPTRSVNPELTPEAEKASKELLENFGDVRAWLTLSDAFIRSGNTETAIAALQSALEAIPGNADLWVQMGIALVAHANGEVVPAARLAFDRASRLEPEHPAPGYFLGLAWLQAGDAEQALETWRALRDRSPADAPWVPMLNEKIATGDRMKAMMEAGGPPPG